MGSASYITLCPKCIVKIHTNATVVFSFSDEAVGMCRYPYHKYIDIGAVLKYSGTIFSPNYPAPYPDDASCMWRFLAPIGKRMTLKFVDFQLRGSSMNDVNSDCNYFVDNVRTDPGLRSFYVSIDCGNQTAFQVHSVGIEMHVTFRAKPVGVRGKRGFKAHFEAVDPRDLTGIYAILPLT